MRFISEQLVKRLRRADRAAGVIVEAVKGIQSHIRSTVDDWAESDSYTGWLRLNRGGGKLYPASNTTIVENTVYDGTFITDMDNDSPWNACFEIVWGYTTPDTDNKWIDLFNLEARLVAQRVGGNPKTVAYWRLQLYRVSQIPETGTYELQPITDIIDVAATGGTTPGTVTFPITITGFEDGPPRPWDPPDQPDEAGGEGRAHPTTVGIIWAVKSDGTAADNVGLDADNGNSAITNNGHQIRRLVLTTGTTHIDHKGRTLVAENGASGVPTIALKYKQYTVSQTITFSGSNHFDLGATPTAGNKIEFIGDGMTPSDSSLVYEINDGVQGWTQVYDGDYIGEDNTATGGADLSAFAYQQTYDIRVTLNPNTLGTASPVVRRMGIQEISFIDLEDIAIVHDPRWGIDPDTMKGEISECMIEVLKDGVVDFRDWATELLATTFLNEFHFRVMIGHADLNRKDWLHIDDFFPEDYEVGAASIRFRCLSALHNIRQVLPVYDSGTQQREVLEYAAISIKDAYNDILTGQVAIQDRFIGAPPEDDTTTVAKTIRDSDAKDEMDALAYIAGGGIITSQGEIVFKDMTTRRPADYAFDRREIAWGAVSPGHKYRVPEFFVPYSWVPDENRYDQEVRSVHASSLTKLGTARIETRQVVDEIISKWIDTTALATAVSSRKTLNQGAGLIIWPFLTTYPHPELEVGDVVVVHTDKFVGRDPSTDNQIKGEVWALGVICQVTGVMHQNFRVWIRDFNDILPSEISVTRLSYYIPKPLILSVVGTFDETDGSLDARVQCELPDSASIKIAASTSTYPTAATVRGETAVNLDGEGTAEKSFTGPYDVGQIVFLSAFAYSETGGSGEESPLFTVPYVRAHLTNYVKALQIVYYAKQIGSNPFISVQGLDVHYSLGPAVKSFVWQTSVDGGGWSSGTTVNNSSQEGVVSTTIVPPGGDVAVRFTPYDAVDAGGNAGPQFTTGDDDFRPNIFTANNDGGSSQKGFILKALPGLLVDEDGADDTVTIRISARKGTGAAPSLADGDIYLQHET